MGETKKATDNVVRNEKGLIYKPEENKLVVSGILVNFRHSTTKYSKGEEYFQVSIRTESLTPEVVKMIKERYFFDTIPKYFPSFIKDAEETGCKEPIYINLKSRYEISTFREGEGNTKYSYDDVIELGEGLPPNGSEVKLSIRLKVELDDKGNPTGKGSVYPLGLLITKLQKQDAGAYFD